MKTEIDAAIVKRVSLAFLRGPSQFDFLLTT